MMGKFVAICEHFNIWFESFVSAFIDRFSVSIDIVLKSCLYLSLTFFLIMVVLLALMIILCHMIDLVTGYLDKDYNIDHYL